MRLQHLVFSLTTLVLTAIALVITARLLPINPVVDLSNSQIRQPLPDPAVRLAASKSTGEQTAVFAGGCFWGVEAVFEHLQGVTDVASGYSGGDAATAEYETVSSGRTGHAESVKVTYDPSKISYEQLLKVYFSVAHDPTQVNRQGPDRGTQYRSALFFANPQQRQVAQAYIDQLNRENVFSKPIATQLSPLNQFYRAEEYHQDFVKQNPQHPYIVVHDLPKLEQLRRQFPELYRP